ncbi:MAG: malectin domain-containing carbohydrate-binding protein [Acidobacteriaceae bacterium]
MGSGIESAVHTGTDAGGPFEEERQEVARLLALPEIARSNNLVRLISFICNKYFEGKPDEIREYSIAVEAFGRKPDFDPQDDSIVRVTAGILRKKLIEIYSGAEPRKVQLVLPVGHYVPQFIHYQPDPPDALVLELDSSSGQAIIPRSRPADTGSHSWIGRLWPALKIRTRLIYVCFCIGMIVTAALGFWMGLRIGAQKESSPIAVNPRPFEANSLLVSYSPAFFFHFSDRPSFTDQTGTVWQPLPGCIGGEVFHRPDREITGYRETSLFQEGRSGQFQCNIQVPAGKYELHFLFAQTSRFAEAGHDVEIRINGENHLIDNVAEEAGGQARVTAHIVTDVEPEKDGYIHIESLTPDSFLNGLIILPGIPAHMRPIRFITAPTPYTDRLGRRWLPDEFVFGGTTDARAFPTVGAPDAGLFAWERYGHFTYMLPVVSEGHYTLRLYFAETWFGPTKWVPGGVESRIFDVYCNGEALLKNFDILKEATKSNEVVVKEFHNLAPTAQGKIELSFVPVKSFPLVNAIEVEEESPGPEQ